MISESELNQRNVSHSCICLNLLAKTDKGEKARSTQRRQSVGVRPGIHFHLNASPSVWTCVRDRHEVFARRMALSEKQTDTGGNAPALAEGGHGKRGDVERSPEHNES